MRQTSFHLRSRFDPSWLGYLVSRRSSASALAVRHGRERRARRNAVLARQSARGRRRPRAARAPDRSRRSHGDPRRTATCSFQRNARGGVQCGSGARPSVASAGPHTSAASTSPVSSSARVSRGDGRARQSRCSDCAARCAKLWSWTPTRRPASAVERRRTVRPRRPARTRRRSRAATARGGRAADPGCRSRHRRRRVALAARQPAQRQIARLDLGETRARRRPHRLERRPGVVRHRLHDVEIETASTRAVRARRVVLEEADAQRRAGRAGRRRLRGARGVTSDATPIASARPRAGAHRQPLPARSSKTTSRPASGTIDGLPTIASTPPPPPTPTARKVRPSIW